MHGWTITLSFFGASVTLARNPEQQWTTPQNASPAGHAKGLKRSGRIPGQKRFKRLFGSRSA